MFTPDSILASFCYVLELSPFHLLAYYPFRKHLRYPAWVVFFLAGSNLAAEFLVCCYLFCNGKDVRNMDLLFALVSMIIYFSCVKTELPKLIFMYVMIINYTMIVRGIAIFLIVWFFYDEQTTFLLLGSPSNTIIRMIPSLLSTPFMLYFLNITRERVLCSHAPKLWSTMWMLPTLTTAVILLFTWNPNTISTAGLTYLTARIILLILFIMIYYILVNSLESVRLQGEAEERARNQEQFIALQHNQYIQLQRQIEETRQARHDLRQHLHMIQAYLDKGDNEQLKEYIRKYGEKLPLNTGKIYCSNYAVDTVVRYYAEKAENANIRFDTQLQLPKTLPIEEPDICILLGNLLENAVDACCRITDQHTFIKIHAQIAGDSAISITVDNSCPTMPTVKNQQLQSTKHPTSGLGTLSIRNIAAQYHGFADFQYENNVFYASVFLNPQPAGTDLWEP